MKNSFFIILLNLLLISCGNKSSEKSKTAINNNESHQKKETTETLKDKNGKVFCEITFNGSDVVDAKFSDGNSIALSVVQDIYSSNKILSSAYNSLDFNEDGIIDFATFLWDKNKENGKLYVYISNKSNKNWIRTETPEDYCINCGNYGNVYTSNISGVNVIDDGDGAVIYFDNGKWEYYLYD